MYRLGLIILCFLMSSSSLYAVQRYQSAYDQSQWSVKTSPIHCELIHPINRYGDGRFVFSSGGELAFQLHVVQGAPRDSVASLHSIAPFWRQPYEKELAQLTINQGSMPVYIGGTLALRLMYELEQGRHPTFHYKDWADYQDDVYVSVSSVNFRENLADFQRCMADALPYGSDALKDTAVYFGKNRHMLTAAERKRLDEIILFAQFDRNLKVKLIGHADGWGTRRYNLRLSKKRVQAVKDYLLASGLQPQQISDKAVGESRPVASNRTLSGRKNNRRVDIVIQH